jgi:ATP-dependent Clp protease ATP-binding subunit ClpC
MRMKNFNLTPRVKKAIQEAQNVAKEMGHERVNCAHVFKTVLELDYPLFNNLFRPYLINRYDLASEVIPFVLENHPTFFKKRVNQKAWHNEVEEILKFSNETSIQLEQEYVGVEHVLYALIMTSPTVRGFLAAKKFPVDRFADALIEAMSPKTIVPQEEQAVEQEDSSMETEKAEDVKYIRKYCVDLNKLALEKKLNNVYGRDKEIESLTEILLRKNKSNAILVGDPGVGKTAIVEGLAHKITHGEATDLLSDKIILSLNLGSLVAGTKYRGQFEERFQGLLDNLKKDRRYILFIDEIHTVIGAGSGEGSLDAANMIKPALARGEITCIGATTQSEHKKLFEKDGALKRRFEAVVIDEPSIDQTINIIKNAKTQFEDFHNVNFSEEVVKDLIYLCEKYMPYRKFPDKALDMMDFIGSKIKIRNFKMPKNIKQLEKKIKATLNGEPNSQTRIKCSDMIMDYSEKLYKWSTKNNKKVEVSREDLISFFAERLQINKEKIVISDNESGEDIASSLKKFVFGQDKAIDKISDVLTCSRAGLKAKNKPLGKFLFIGPTGVGKTWTAKLLADKFFGNEKLMLKLDMSEYQESSTINKLIGSTIGYIGCEEGGILTEFVRNHPNAVVLFDEIEKAHKDLSNILLQIMDEGYVTDSLGRRIDFTNTIIILTGNIGHETAKPKPSLGFIQSAEEPSDNYKKAVESFFRPEFLARLDEVVIFEKIAGKEFHQMLEKLISKTKTLLNEQGRVVDFGEEVFSFLLKKLEQNGNNARMIEKIYRQNFEIPLAKYLLSNSKKEISAKIDNENVSFA